MSLDDSALKNLCLWCEFQSRLLFIISLLLKTFSDSPDCKEQTIQVHFLVAPSLCLKARLSAKPLIWKWFFLLVWRNLKRRKVTHLALFWKWESFGTWKWPTYWPTLTVFSSRPSSIWKLNELASQFWSSMYSTLADKLYLLSLSQFCAFVHVVWLLISQ